MPLLWLSLAFLGGIVLGEWLGGSLGAWLSLAALALGFGICRRLLARYLPSGFSSYVSRFVGRLPRLPDALISPVPYSLLLVFLFLGAARYRSGLPKMTPDFIAWYNDRETRFVVEGLLVSMPDERDTYTNLRLEVDQLHPAGELLFTPVEGLLLAKVLPGGSWRYGDRVRLEGYLQTPFESEEFSYRDYLARQGIYSYLSCSRDDEDCARLLLRDQGNPLLARIYDLRARALGVVYQLFPDPEASLMAGILLGIESGISEDVWRAFRDTGTAHIIAISGFNFAIVASLFALVFGRLLGRWRGMLASILAIALYAVLAGASAPVVRAAIMGGSWVFARQLGRRQHGLNTLAFVAALMALFDPQVLWDVGFQLSFMATLGLVLYAEPLAGAFLRFASRYVKPETAQRLVGPVGEYFLFTLAAQVTTLPVVLYYFQRLSLVSFLANPLILPAQPPLMVLGGLSVILGLLYQPLGQLAAYLAWPFVVYTIRLVEILARAPAAAITLGRVSLLGLLVFYALLFAWTFAGGRARSWLAARRVGEGGEGGLLSSPTVWVAVLVLLALLATLVWGAALSAPDGRLHLTVLDVGSGDGLLIQSPSGRSLLIDGGPSPNRLSDALGRRLPLANRGLDWLVVAAAGEEQLVALPVVLERFPPGEVLWSGPPAGSYSARRLRRILAEADTPITTADAGQSLDLGEGATLELLAVTRRGAVLRLEWGEFSALLPIGLDFESLETLMAERSLGPVTALLLADSGYAPLNTPEWIARWRPQVVLLSVAADDQTGRPDPETLEALDGYTLLRTDLDGWIHLSTDGERLWVEVER